MTIFVLIGFLGIILFWLAATRPANWGKLYVIAAIILCGMVYQQISFIDEYLVACVLMGGILIFTVRLVDVSSLPEDRLGKIHKILFYTFCFYFAAQSVRGMLLTDFNKIRWVVYFLSIALGAWMLSFRSFALPEGRQLVKVIVKATLAYFVFLLNQYLVCIGQLVRIFFGVGHAMQCILS